MGESKHVAKQVAITLSISSELHALLHAKVQSRGISKYVSNAVLEAFKRDELQQNEKLEAAYAEANQDPDRRQVLKDLGALDATDDIEGWEW